MNPHNRKTRGPGSRHPAMDKSGRRSGDRIFFPWELPPFSAIYIHIPFCRNLCGYCHFYRVEPTVSEISSYPEALVHELTARAGDLPGVVRSVYVGGGTPTLMRASFYREMMALIKERFDLPPGAEVTIEADMSVSSYQLEKLAEAGFNRISLGIKSYSDRGLDLLGIKGAPGRGELVRIAREAGFASVGIDLLYGYAGQDNRALALEMEAAAAAMPDHISMYSLQAEPGATPAEADDDLTAEMYRSIRRILQAAGYQQYEISNFARPGHACRHNLNYWQDGDYLGLGPAAHSAVSDDGERRRWRNPEDLEVYMTAPADCREELGRAGGRERAAEALMMALRLTEGVAREQFAARYGIDPVILLGEGHEIFTSQGLLRTSQDRMRLTTRGMLLSNEVFQSLV